MNRREFVKLGAAAPLLLGLDFPEVPAVPEVPQKENSARDIQNKIADIQKNNYRYYSICREVVYNRLRKRYFESKEAYFGIMEQIATIINDYIPFDNSYARASASFALFVLGDAFVVPKENRLLRQINGNIVYRIEDAQGKVIEYQYSGYVKHLNYGGILYTKNMVFYHPSTVAHIATRMEQHWVYGDSLFAMLENYVITEDECLKIVEESVKFGFNEWASQRST